MSCSPRSRTLWSSMTTENISSAIYLRCPLNCDRIMRTCRRRRRYASRGMKMNNEKYDALKLENQLCFPLYACSREIIKQYKPFLDELDLTYTQYITMMVLWEKKTLTSKELGNDLFLDSGTLTPLLKKMEAKGLLNRRRSEEDERNLVVSITEAGERLRERAIEIPGKIAKCSNLERADAEALYRILYKVLKSNSGKK